jgi:MinD superfamily P-loop ATPase
MSRPLRLAVASGKGGTGKTTIATNLAVALGETGARVAYVDCDVEEPNGHLFLRPVIRQRREVSIPVPVVDETRCTRCGACGTACRFSAILMLPKKVLTFPHLCHGCGGCTRACPEDAIREAPRPTGTVEEGVAGEVGFVHGTLAVGEAMAPPVIRAVLAAAPADRTLVLDAPPGTSCPVITSIKTADVVLLVTEPTPFGLNDLELAVDMVRALGLPFGVAVNRAGTGDRGVYEYCARAGIPVVLELPDDRRIAEAYSRGELALRAIPALKSVFLGLLEKLTSLARLASQRTVGPRASTTVVNGEAGPLPSQTPGARRAGLRELVVVSGKGGTGKTSVVASFAALAQAAVADCDVDAADLHLVLDPAVRHRWPFAGGKTALIDADRCTGCGVCAERCRFGAVRERADAAYEVDPISCEGCGVCVDTCPEQAAALVASPGGAWFVSETRYGPLTHARLGVAQENSGKLVSLVRREAKAAAAAAPRELLICDGSPGIGCPVIASVAGAGLVLVVTEPTLSGRHDLGRVLELCRRFHLKTAICINKADLNPAVADAIAADAAAQGVPVLGRIRYDESVTAAQVKRLAVVEHGEGPAATDIRALWERVNTLMRSA